MRKNILALIALITILNNIYAQDSSGVKDDINNLLKEESHKEYVEASFKAPRVVMSHSIEMVKPGVLSFLIMHRFGNVNLGAYEFFGLDRATIRLGFDYGISKDLTIGIGRGDYRKEFDDFLKYRLIHQSVGPKAMPLSLVLVAGSTIQTLKSTGKKLDFSNRLGFYGQILIGRKFSEDLSLQIGPAIVHRNLVAAPNDPNDTYAIEFGGRIKLTHRISFNLDYYLVINKDKSITTYDPLSIGFDLETGGHVF